MKSTPNNRKLFISSFEKDIKPLIVRNMKARESKRIKQKVEIEHANKEILRKLYQINERIGFGFSNRSSSTSFNRVCKKAFNLQNQQNQIEKVATGYVPSPFIITVEEGEVEKTTYGREPLSP